jgi:hypothetical protein
MMRARTWRYASFAATWSLCVATGCSSADSRQAESGESSAAPTKVVPTGTPLVFSVDEQVSTDTHDKGDVFSATLRYGVSDEEGGELVPVGVQSRWVVSEASARDGEALLAVQLTSIQVNGEWTPVVGDVTQAEVQADHPDTNTETGAKIAVGTAAGAILGQILGSDTRSTLAGAGVGATVGTVVALSTRGGKAVLPQGSVITVRLSEPLVVS